MKNFKYFKKTNNQNSMCVSFIKYFSLLIFIMTFGINADIPSSSETNETIESNVIIENLNAEKYLLENPEDIVVPENLFPIGKYMLDGQLKHAKWLGALYHGKSLREPINVIIEIKNAHSEEAAITNLTVILAKAGYKNRTGHSGGYCGYLSGRIFTQVPSKKHHAFSNEPFELSNNHGRLFGPYEFNGKYYFTGAFSREDR